MDEIKAPSGREVEELFALDIVEAAGYGVNEEEQTILFPPMTDAQAEYSQQLALSLLTLNIAYNWKFIYPDGV